MNGNLKYSGPLAFLTLVLMTGLPGLATAQQATLYELVENLDSVILTTTNHRVSNWTAQGTAQKGSAFCPDAILPPGASSCTITAFGTDDIDLNIIETSFDVGDVWANIVAVANLDNVVDAPEVATFTGQIIGDITILQPNGEPPVEPDLGKKKSLLGPEIPLLYVINGQFFPDAVPVIRTFVAPEDRPTGTGTEQFDSIFRLPFGVTKNGKRETPKRGKTAYYLADDGSLIKVDKQDEFALGYPLLRAEVYFR